MSTTHINEPTEQNGKQVVIQLGGEVLLRDYFAAKALWGVLNENHMTKKQMAEWSYDMADAILKAREA